MKAVLLLALFVVGVTGRTCFCGVETFTGNAACAVVGAVNQTLTQLRTNEDDCVILPQSATFSQTYSVRIDSCDSPNSVTGNVFADNQCSAQQPVAITPTGNQGIVNSACVTPTNSANSFRVVCQRRKDDGAVALKISIAALIVAMFSVLFH
eukprot:TRINITY_DN18971_c0_g1_i1.p1 TRINITY_DN18971_c0_g1~~TRINITY_DN18971_c0_g1_i1.p1  ORF type:complete len:166 (+),score=5.45 TRINITY_DN18971_c0_g1_i1:43-498(+)